MLVAIILAGKGSIAVIVTAVIRMQHLMHFPCVTCWASFGVVPEENLATVLNWAVQHQVGRRSWTQR